MNPGAPASTLVAFRFEAPAAAEEAVVTALWECGTTGIHVQAGPPGEVALVAYFINYPTLEADLQRVLAACGVTRFEPAPIPDVDWVARFREGFRAFTVGGFMLAPAWEPPPPGSCHTRVLRILPGRAFGTGTHESTRLCLSALESLAARRPLGRVLDVGGGSGILAIAAAVLGAGPVAAVDIDPDAAESARLHAGLNAVDLLVVLGDGGKPFAPGVFDLVLANLTAPLLLEKRLEIAALCGPSSRVVLAGFLREDADRVAGAYAPLGALTPSVDGEWAALVIEARS
jgi:ribosomal protein L11 methyltransferase